MPDFEACLLHLAGARMAEEIVPGVNVVDAQAVGAGETLADVALEQRRVVDDRVATPVFEPALGHGLPTRLTTARWLHRGIPTASGGVRLGNYDSIVPAGA